MQNFTSIILYMIMNIICNAQWLYGANFEILHCTDVFSERQKLLKQGSTFKQTHVIFFYRNNMNFSITSQLC